jgi:hypothetical protein
MAEGGGEKGDCQVCPRTPVSAFKERWLLTCCCAEVKTVDLGTQRGEKLRACPKGAFGEGMEAGWDLRSGERRNSTATVCLRTGRWAWQGVVPTWGRTLDILEGTWCECCRNCG